MFSVLGGVQPGTKSLADITFRVANYYLAPGGLSLTESEIGLVGRPDREHVLAQALATATGFDYILLDCPPSLGLLTVNALTSARYVIIPVQPEFLALRGLAMMNTTIKRVQREFNPQLATLGVVASFYDPRLIHQREVITAIEEQGFPVLAKINRSIRFAESALAGEHITTYAPEIPGALAFLQLADKVEVLTNE